MMDFSFLTNALFTSSEPSKRYVTSRGALVLAVYLAAIAGLHAVWFRTTLRTALDQVEQRAAIAASQTATASTTADRRAAAPAQRTPAVVTAGRTAGGSPSSGDAQTGETSDAAPEAPDNSGDSSAPQAPDNASDATAAQQPLDLPTTAVLAASTGALGGTLHASRSLYWYAGNRTLAVSWLPMYVMKPFVSALLSTIVCMVLGAGLWQGGPKQDDVIQIVAVAALVGLFSDEASEKLRQIASAIFTPREQGRDHQAGRGPSILGVAPANLASAAAAQAVTVSIKECKAPAVAWLTDPNHQVKTVPTAVPANSNDTVTFDAVLDQPGKWTLRVTDCDGRTSEPREFTVS